MLTESNCQSTIKKKIETNERERETSKKEWIHEVARKEFYYFVIIIFGWEKREGGWKGPLRPPFVSFSTALCPLEHGGNYGSFQSSLSPKFPTIKALVQQETLPNS
jgi:hypothetical protein